MWTPGCNGVATVAVNCSLPSLAAKIHDPCKVSICMYIDGTGGANGGSSPVAERWNVGVKLPVMSPGNGVIAACTGKDCGCVSRRTNTSPSLPEPVVK